LASALGWQEAIEGGFECGNFGINASFFSGAHHALGHVFIKDAAGHPIEGTPHGGNLHQDIWARAAFIDHLLDASHMAFDAGQTVDNLPQRFFIVDVGMGVD